jgi:hypothetical protein
MFSTRFGCNFECSPLVSDVILNVLHSFRVYFFTRVFSVSIALFSASRIKISNLSIDLLYFSKLRERTNSLARLMKSTLETSGEDGITTLETSGEDVKLHSKRVEKTHCDCVEGIISFILSVAASLSVFEIFEI